MTPNPSFSSPLVSWACAAKSSILERKIARAAVLLLRRDRRVESACELARAMGFAVTEAAWSGRVGNLILCRHGLPLEVRETVIARSVAESMHEWSPTLRVEALASEILALFSTASDASGARAS